MRTDSILVLVVLLSGAPACSSSGELAPRRDVPVAISQGVGMSCALFADGRASCWGDTRGQVDGPQPPYVAVSAGQRFACGVRAADQGVDCWGAKDSPVLETPTGAFARVSAGTHHACAVTSAGDATCWGHDFTGELSVPSGRWQTVDAGELMSCGVRSDGSAACWGMGVGSPTS
jgi:hypothetical protein